MQTDITTATEQEVAIRPLPTAGIQALRKKRKQERQARKRGRR